ncbi:hypothetical protein Rcae01_05054 [Novipirellula caenicola]|uniref:Uncharacterized protein n=1 Tax=Novipirellula caenicola TaxID=1536901 RepID=A0ABP9VWN2_9BACT
MAGGSGRGNESCSLIQPQRTRWLVHDGKCQKRTRCLVHYGKCQKGLVALSTTVNAAKAWIHYVTSTAT